MYWDTVAHQNYFNFNFQLVYAFNGQFNPDFHRCSKKGRFQYLTDFECDDGGEEKPVSDLYWLEVFVIDDQSIVWVVQNTRK